MVPIAICDLDSCRKQNNTCSLSSTSQDFVTPLHPTPPQRRIMLKDESKKMPELLFVSRSYGLGMDDSCSDTNKTHLNLSQQPTARRRSLIIEEVLVTDPVIETCFISCFFFNISQALTPFLCTSS